MLANITGRRNPRNCGERTRLSFPQEICNRLNVAKLRIFFHGVEVGQRVPDTWRFGILLNRRTILIFVILAIRFSPFDDVIAPTHVVVVQKIGKSVQA